MNAFKFLLVCLVCHFIIQNTHAQSLSKEEIKELKKELKDLEKNPEFYKKLKDEEASLNRQIQDREALLREESSVADILNRQIRDKDQEIELLRQQFSDLNNQLTSSRLPVEDSTSQNTTLGEVYFSVQIGAYRSEKIAQILKDNTNFTIEEDNNSGLKKYLIGKFNSYKEAKSLCKLLAKSGAQCFIVGFKDNARVNHLKQLPAKYF